MVISCSELKRGRTDISKISENGEQPTHNATRGLGTVRYFGKVNVDANALDSCGYIPLHRAACDGLIDTARYLIEHGA